MSHAIDHAAHVEHEHEHEPLPSHPARHAPTPPAALTLLRVGAGLLFMQHGAQKLFGWFGGFGPDHGTAPLMSQMGLAGTLEFFGGALIVLGLLTRFVAPLLAIEMIWAFIQAHLPHGGFPIQNGGELSMLYALVFIALTFFGPGPWSLDSSMGGRRRHGALG